MRTVFLPGDFVRIVEHPDKPIARVISEANNGTFGSQLNIEVKNSGYRIMTVYKSSLEKLSQAEVVAYLLTT